MLVLTGFIVLVYFGTCPVIQPLVNAGAVDEVSHPLFGYFKLYYWI